MTPACSVCGRESELVAGTLGVCGECLRSNSPATREMAELAHIRVRREFGMAFGPPRYADGVPCSLCAHECRLPEGGQGYCGVRRAVGGRLRGGSADRAAASWYYDPLPTNCVADWVCPGGVGSGYPEFAHLPGPEVGYFNLAVFYASCSFDCLFCQNWHYRLDLERERPRSAAELADAVSERTSCVCYFGGDPTPQLPHALKAARLARSRRQGRILRICWETNGSMNPGLLDQMIAISLESGGCIKFDLKAFSEPLHQALTGASNRRTLENFAYLAGRHAERPDPPLAVASTLLIPGYVDTHEVSEIAGFIAKLDPEIPYTLLAFAPQFRLNDLPSTSYKQAKDCEAAALAAGLRRVHIGNLGLLR